MEYTRENPFFASVKTRYSLCPRESIKQTYHLELDISGSGISYDVGDCIAVLPINPPDLVQKTLDAIQATGEEIVKEKKTEKEYPLREFLSQHANIADVPRPLIKKLNPALLEDREALKHFQAHHEVWDAIVETPNTSISPQELADNLQPLLPRFYSIASSMDAVGDEIHLTIGMVCYQTREQQRKGICTHYLCVDAPLNEPIIPIYIHKHKGFTIPADPTSHMIMVGPGTGIAPYRGFMQKRMAQKATGRHWLFFGECHRDHHYFYGDYWEDLNQQGSLKVDLAFSRDQEEKVYVQNRMLENAKELFQWLEEGATFYVCGDASRMAKDVDAILHQIIEQEGKVDAKAYVKKLKEENRYLRDVY